MFENFDHLDKFLIYGAFLNSIRTNSATDFTMVIRATRPIVLGSMEIFYRLPPSVITQTTIVSIR